MRSCILCHTASSLLFEDPKGRGPYFHCPCCDLRFLEPSKRLNAEQEEGRYRLHQNLVGDPGYHRFMDPMVQLIRQTVPAGSRVLDFGCGAATVLAHLLQDYNVTSYDPFFHPDPDVFSRRYDFIAAIEVFEHLYQPDQVLTELISCLDGHLGVMTLLVTPSTDFARWWYRDDPTHVGFFSPASFRWIQSHWKFESLDLRSDRLVHLRVGPNS